MIYLDHAATTKPAEGVLNCMEKVGRECYGNASSVYEYGARSRTICNEAKKTIAQAIGSKDSEIYITSGGTEGNNWCIKMSAFSNTPVKEKHFITTMIEHPSVLQSYRYVERFGGNVSYIPPETNGRVDVNKLMAAVKHNTCLISVMAANNETGVIQPINEIGEAIGRYNEVNGTKIRFHVDAVQAFGSEYIDVKQLKIDFLTASAHKFYGPKGVGFLYKKDDIMIEPLLHGGGQEEGLRSGTENIVAIAGMTEAVRLIQENKMSNRAYVLQLRNQLEEGLRQSIKDLTINGGHDIKGEDFRLPGHLNISVPGIDGSTLLTWLDLEQICVSTGSACAAGSAEPSHVLTAMGIDPQIAASSLRFSLGVDNNSKEIARVVDVMGNLVLKLRYILGV